MANKNNNSNNARKKPKPRKSKSQLSKRQRDVESVDMRSDSRLEPEQRGSSDYHTGKPNDWRWYAQNPQLVSDYASFPFGAPLGNLLQYGDRLYDSTSVPGVCAIHFCPAVGLATNENSPINVAMRRLYSFVRHANSGASNYDAPDLMLYMLCVDSALMYHEYLKRAYGVLQDYTAFNRYYPKALITAMGINFDDITANIASFRGYINQYAIKLSQLWIPNSMSYMARHAWMCQGLYTDGTSEKAQTYMYVPDYFLQFTLTEGVGSAVAIEGPARTAGGATFKSLMDFGNSLLNPMISNEDFGIMSGDILKAFGSSGIVRPLAITDQYQVLPVYDQEVLSQMENATLLTLAPGGANQPILTVTQSTAVGTGYLKSGNKFEVTIGTADVLDAGTEANCAALAAVYSNRQLLNMHHSGVTPAEVMVATRLMNVLEFSTPMGWSLDSVSKQITTLATVPTMGSEIVTRTIMYKFGGSQGVTTGLQAMPIQKTLFHGASVSGSINTLPIANMFNSLTTVTSFDWHPGIYLGLGLGKGVFPTLPIQDIDYYTFLDKENLVNMTTAALLSEFSIPQI